MVLTKNVRPMIKGLDLSLDFFEFLGKSRIDPGTDYLKEVDKYESHFIRQEDAPFLLKMESKEMCFYIPSHTRITFERHNLGIGIFNMQGFERRNKESKNIYKRFTNINKKELLTNQ